MSQSPSLPNNRSNNEKHGSNTDGLTIAIRIRGYYYVHVTFILFQLHEADIKKNTLPLLCSGMNRVLFFSPYYFSSM